MKLECVREKIYSAISITEKVTGKNPTLAILGSVLLFAQNKTLKLRATNLDLGIEIEIPANIKEEGIVAISGSVLSNLLSNIHSKSVNLEVDGKQNLSITSKNTKTIIKGYPYNDFPILPKVSKENSFILPIEKFIEGIKSVWYSAAISDIKPEISSVYIFTQGDAIFFTATDSFRLAEKKMLLNKSLKNLSLLVPFKNISELIRIFDGKEGDVTLNFNNNQATFQTEEIYVTSRIIDGIFPDYNQILPKEFTTEIVVLKQDLLNALKITNIFSDKFNKITLTIKPSKKIFEIASNNADVGKNNTIIDGAISGEEVTVHFNYKYIIDCFQSIKQDSIALKFNGPTQPMVIQGVGDGSFTYLVMPLNQ